MNSLKGKVVHQGAKHLVVEFSARLSQEQLNQTLDFLSFSDLSIKSGRIEGISFAIEEKLGAHLYWMRGDEEIYLLPMEGKSYFGFEKFEYLQGPEGATGIRIKFFNQNKFCAPAGVFILVKLVKQ